MREERPSLNPDELGRTSAAAMPSSWTPSPPFVPLIRTGVTSVAVRLSADVTAAITAVAGDRQWNLDRLGKHFVPEPLKSIFCYVAVEPLEFLAVVEAPAESVRDCGCSVLLSPGAEVLVAVDSGLREKSSVDMFGLWFRLPRDGANDLKMSDFEYFRRDFESGLVMKLFESFEKKIYLRKVVLGKMPGKDGGIVPLAQCINRYAGMVVLSRLQ
ncbi:uncharacterized protein DS421_14g448790 [Arachis hypogaea]|nr:uncharacterized protein DS421_14g448790 [Arachis hypogaea]